MKYSFGQFEACIGERSIRGSRKQNQKQPGTIHLLKFKKTLRGFGLFCHYPVAVTRCSIIYVPFFQKIPVAIIESNTKGCRSALEPTNLDADEQALSPDLERLYNDLSVEEEIEISLKLSSSGEVPEIPRLALKSFSRLAVPTVHFESKKI